jgi:hypothetical protein
MNINNLEKIKVYDRYDGDLVSLLYDKDIKEYYLEIAYELWDKYIYFNVELNDIINFTFNKKTLESMILNKECLLYENTVFSKSLGFYNKENIDLYEKGWYDYVFEDWSLADRIAYSLMGYSLISEEILDTFDIDCYFKYIDRDGCYHNQFDLNNIQFLLDQIEKISKYNNFTMTINKYGFNVNFLNREIKSEKIQDVLYKSLELYFFGVFNETGDNNETTKTI